MPAMPQLGGNATSGVNANGSTWAFGGGDWNVNLGGSGLDIGSPPPATAFPGGSIMPLALAALGVLWAMK